MKFQFMTVKKICKKEGVSKNKRSFKIFTRWSWSIQIEIVVNDSTRLFRTKSLSFPLSGWTQSVERGVVGIVVVLLSRSNPIDIWKNWKNIMFYLWISTKRLICIFQQLYICSCCCKLNNVCKRFSQHVWTLNVKVHLPVFLLLQCIKNSFSDS